MRHRIRIVLGIALALSFATDHAFGAEGRVRKHRQDVKTLLTATAFSDVGEFSGALEGTILIHDTFYRLAPSVWIYDVDRGAIPAGTYVEHGILACSGVTLGGTQVVYHIILRSGSEEPARDVAPIRAVRMEDAGPR